MKPMKMTSILAATLLFSSVQASAGWWPNLPDIGVSIPPLSEWAIGGTIGSTWEGNKEALRLGAIGTAVLGPVGLIYGMSEGAKYDIQKRHAKKAYESWIADEELKNRIFTANTTYKTSSEAAAKNYQSTSEYLGDVNAPDEAFLTLNDNLFGFNMCLINVQNKMQANNCLDDVEEANRDLRRKWSNE